MNRIATRNLDYMKKQMLLGTLLTLLTLASARGSLHYNFTGGSIPDESSPGVIFSGTVSDAAGMTVSGLTVGLSISGGYNGYLYAYLVAPNGMRVTLMDQPGVSESNPFGASGAGMNITLQDGSGTDHGWIQNETSSSFLTGSYNAAGTLANFNGSAVNGTWELFFASEASVVGRGASTLDSWSLDITAVPEPVNVALTLFGIMAIAIGFVRRATRKAAGSALKNRG